LKRGGIRSGDGRKYGRVAGSPYRRHIAQCPSSWMPRIVRSGIENGSPSAKCPPRASRPPLSVNARPPARVAVKKVVTKSAR
jgi:hypothetical protein